MRRSTYPTLRCNTQSPCGSRCLGFPVLPTCNVSAIIWNVLIRSSTAVGYSGQFASLSGQLCSYSACRILMVPYHGLLCCPGTHWTPTQIRTRTMDWLHQYKEKHIDTGSIKPLTDTIVALFFFSYAVAWPQVQTLIPQPACTARGPAHNPCNSGASGACRFGLCC